MNRRKPIFRRRRHISSRLARGAKITAEEDLSPDSSPPKNPTSLPPPVSPSLDLTASIPPPSLPVRAGDDPRPWVKMRRRRLPHYYYRRLPNSLIPDKALHAPYFAANRSIPQAENGVVAAGDSEAATVEDWISEEEEERV